jgi:hypothetical protein
MGAAGELDRRDNHRRQRTTAPKVGRYPQLARSLQYRYNTRPLPAARPRSRLTHEVVVTKDGASSNGRYGANGVTEHRDRPRRPCPRRARSSGLQRSPAVNSGQQPGPLTCATAEGRAAVQCFPSSR